MTLDELANEMRKNQNNPTSNVATQVVWDPEKSIFVKLAPGEELGNKIVVKLKRIY